MQSPFKRSGGRFSVIPSIPIGILGITSAIFWEIFSENSCLIAEYSTNVLLSSGNLVQSKEDSVGWVAGIAEKNNGGCNCIRRSDGTPEGIRTPDTWFRRPVLYPLSYGRSDLLYVVGGLLCEPICCGCRFAAISIDWFCSGNKKTAVSGGSDGCLGCGKISPHPMLNHRVPRPGMFAHRQGTFLRLTDLLYHRLSIPVPSCHTCDYPNF